MINAASRLQPTQVPVPRHVFVTGGGVSSLGKGLTAASLGRLLRARGISVVMQKLDPYIIVVGRSTPLTGVGNMLSQAMSRPSASLAPTAIPSSTPMRAAMTRTTSEGAGRGQDGQQRRQER